MDVYEIALADIGCEGAIRYSQSAYPGVQRRHASMLDAIGRSEDVPL